jgi:hypothetical protein
MSLTVVVQETALRALARIRSEDREAFASIRQALAALADQPHPDQAVFRMPSSVSTAASSVTSQSGCGLGPRWMGID